MTLGALLAFCGLGVVLAVTPGPDTFLTLRYSLRRTRLGLAAAAGSSLGSLVWAALVGIGLAALIEQSAEAYRVIKIFGGLYLIYLGIRAFVQSRRHAREVTTAVAAPRGSVLAAFGSGLLSCTLNPKVGLFFLAIVPQFLPQHGNRFLFTMGLGAIDTVISMIYLTIVCLVAARANEWLNRPRVTKVLERVSGGILAALGIGTVTAGLLPGDA